MIPQTLSHARNSDCWVLLYLQGCYHLHAPNQTCWFVVYLVNSPVDFPLGANRAGKVASCKREEV